jgi:hypothetical protein
MVYYNVRRKVAVAVAAGFIGIAGICAITDKRFPSFKLENLEAVSTGYYAGNDYIKDVKARDKVSGRLFLYRGTEKGFAFEREIQQ